MLRLACLRSAAWRGRLLSCSARLASSQSRGGGGQCESLESSAFRDPRASSQSTTGFHSAHSAHKLLRADSSMRKSDVDPTAPQDLLWGDRGDDSCADQALAIDTCSEACDLGSRIRVALTNTDPPVSRRTSDSDDAWGLRTNGVPCVASVPTAFASIRHAQNIPR